jgi:hypothetical protein
MDIHFCEELKYGYIEGEVDAIFNILFAIGLNITKFSDQDLINLKLSDFDTIIIGPNAYMSRHLLRNYKNRFLEFVKNGGTLIVQYQRYPYADGGYTPYSFSYNMPHDRITQRNAKIEIIQPEDSIFKIPNMITENDFDNWVVDRGLYFWKNWDNNYTALLACNDEVV